MLIVQNESHTDRLLWKPTIKYILKAIDSTWSVFHCISLRIYHNILWVWRDQVIAVISNILSTWISCIKWWNDYYEEAVDVVPTRPLQLTVNACCFTSWLSQQCVWCCFIIHEFMGLIWCQKHQTHYVLEPIVTSSDTIRNIIVIISCRIIKTKPTMNRDYRKVQSFK